MSLDIGLTIKVDTGNPDITEIEVGNSFNMTHNVAPMWRNAGCYDALYNSAGKAASEVLPVLRTALAKMQDSPAEFKAMNPPNNWGDYDGAVEWLTEVIAEFAKYPKAVIWLSK